MPQRGRSRGEGTKWNLTGTLLAETLLAETLPAEILLAGTLLAETLRAETLPRRTPGFPRRSERGLPGRGRSRTRATWSRPAVRPCASC